MPTRKPPEFSADNFASFFEEVGSLSSQLRDMARIEGEICDSLRKILEGSHVCVQAERINDVVNEVKSSDLKLAVTDRRIGALEDHWKHTNHVGLVVGLFVIGLVISAVVAFFTLRADVQVLSRDVESILNMRHEQSSNGEIANILPLPEQKLIPIQSPGRAQDAETIHDLCLRATAKEKRMIIGWLGSDADGCI
jgi:hypothetical protein